MEGGEPQHFYKRHNFDYFSHKTEKMGGRGGVIYLLLIIWHYKSLYRGRKKEFKTKGLHEILLSVEFTAHDVKVSCLLQFI